MASWSDYLFVCLFSATDYWWWASSRSSDWSRYIRSKNEWSGLLVLLLFFNHRQLVNIPASWNRYIQHFCTEKS